MLRTTFRPFDCRATLAALLALVTLSLRGEEEKKPETNVTVSVAKAIRTTLHSYVTGYATVETAPVAARNQPAGGARLGVATPGLVIAVNAVEGARVEKGALIIQLDSRAADAALSRAQALLTAAEKTRARQTQLQAAEGTSERAVQEAEAQWAAAKSEVAVAQQMQSLLAIRAPMAGTIAWVKARPGEWLDVGKDVAEIVDLDRLVLVTQIPSAEAAAIHTDQTATAFARFSANEKPLAEGMVKFVAPQVTVANDSVLVRIGLPAGTALRPGQFVAVRITVEEKANCLAVPIESVVVDPEGGATVAVVENNKAVQKKVQPGLRDGDMMEISGDGIAEGTTVVTMGAYGLPKETAVTIRKP